MYMLNRVGDKLQPWRTPWLISISSVCLNPKSNMIVVLLYKLLIVSIRCFGYPWFSSIIHNLFLFILSNAFS